MAIKEIEKKKKKNTGAIFSFILLFLAGGTVFYFGWVQFELPENTYAVLFSKTSGYDDKVLEPGRFNWKWERLLPTNSKLIKIFLERRSVVLNYEGALPSGELYSSIIPQKPDFSYKMTFNISYKLDKDSLPELLEQGIIYDSDIQLLYRTIEAEFIKIIKDSSSDFYNENLGISSNAYLDLENIIMEKLKQRYYYIDIRSLSVQYIHFPDLQLYDKTREIFNIILENRKETEIASEKWAIESKVNLDTKIEILSRYGELLSKYPILVDYFALDPESQVLDISNLKDYKYETSDE